MAMSPIVQAAPRVAVFDVNETLSDLSGLVPRLTEVGAPPDLLPAWFAATLRDGFALTATGCLADFATIGSFTLASMLSDVDDLRGTPEEAAEHVVSAMAQLDLHPDVAPGLRTLVEAGVRVVTLSNGAARVAELPRAIPEVTSLSLAKAGVRALTELLGAQFGTLRCPRRHGDGVRDRHSWHSVRSG